MLVTDPIAHYLIESTELNDITPQSFVRAVEAESDPSAAAVAEIHNAIESGQAQWMDAQISALQNALD